MNINQYGDVFVDQDELFQALYSGKIKKIENLYLNDTDTVIFNSALKSNKENFNPLKSYQEHTESIEDFDKKNRNNWFVPEKYFQFPLVDWLHNQCKTEQEHQRVDQELLLFAQHHMMDVLFYLKYLVDVLRENNIVWGVGRGSSVASFVLYLMGVHKINSLQYDLDIREFLK